MVKGRNGLQRDSGGAAAAFELRAGWATWEGSQKRWSWYGGKAGLLGGRTGTGGREGWELTKHQELHGPLEGVGPAGAHAHAGARRGQGGVVHGEDAAACVRPHGAQAGVQAPPLHRGGPVAGAGQPAGELLRPTQGHCHHGVWGLHLQGSTCGRTALSAPPPDAGPRLRPQLQTPSLSSPTALPPASSKTPARRVLHTFREPPRRSAASPPSVPALPSLLNALS